MARSLTAGMITEITSDQMRPFTAVELVLESTTVRAWSGIGDLTFTYDSVSRTFLGVGTYGGVSAIQETTETKAVGIQLTLTGIPSDLVAACLAEDYQGKDCIVWFGCLSDVQAVVADPYVIFQGRTDTMALQEDTNGAKIVVNAESRMIDLSRRKLRRYTLEDQKIDFPNDLGLEFVGSIQDASVAWGSQFGK